MCMVHIFSSYFAHSLNLSILTFDLFFPSVSLCCVLVCIYVRVVVVAKRNDEVILICNTSTDGAVIWKLHDEVIFLEDTVQQDGQNLNISDVDVPMLGQYSCWRGGELLSSTYLLLEAEENDEFGAILLFHFSFIPNTVNIWNFFSESVLKLCVPDLVECSMGLKVDQYSTILLL